MPGAKLPITGIMYSAGDPTSTAQGTFDLVNAFVDPIGVVRKRPGVISAIDLSGASYMNSSTTRIDGVHFWGKYLFVVGGGELFRIDMSVADPSAAISDWTNGVSGFNSGNGPLDKVTFVHAINNSGTEELFMCNGGNVVHTTDNAATDTTDITSGAGTGIAALDSGVYSIAAMDTYLFMVNSGEDRVYYSKVGDPTGEGTQWSASDFFTAEYKPDDVIGVHTSGSYLYVFGKETTEVWRNDGFNPFSPLKGNTIDYGCIAANTIKEIDGEIYWVNHRRQIMSHKRGDSIGAPINKLLQSDSYIGDPTAATVVRTRVTSGGDLRIDSASKFRIVESPAVSGIHADIIRAYDRDFYVVHCTGMTYNPDDVDTTMNTEGFTLAFDTKSNTWCRWGEWNSAAQRYEMWDKPCADYSEAFNTVAVGGLDDSTVYFLKDSYHDDAGTEIRPMWQSGWLDWGTNVRKRSRRLRVRVRTVAGAVDTASGVHSQLHVRWRDDGSTTWSNTRIMDLTPDKKYTLAGTEVTNQVIDNHVDLFQLGTYRTRQWQIWHEEPASTSPVPLAIHGLEEEFEVLGS